MYLKCQKLWLSFNTWLIGCLRSLLIKEHVSQGWLVQLGEQGTDRENINLCGVCLPHIIIVQFTLGEKSSWLGLLTVKVRGLRDETSQRNMHCSAAEHAPTSTTKAQPEHPLPPAALRPDLPPLRLRFM